MDIYEYFNSRDVAAYCQYLGRSFTASEMAYMIWKSNHHTLHQKMLAWETILNTLSDEVVPDNDSAGGKSLHEFLRAYIARVQDFLKEFQENTADSVFSYEVRYVNASDRYLEESALFTRYDCCVASAVAMSETGKEVLSVRIRKRKIDNPHTERMGDPMLYLTPKGEPVETVVAPYFGEEDLLVAPFGFYGWFLDIPTPFKRGDFVTGVDLWGLRSGPMVIDWLPGQRGGDYIDMCARLWELDRQGRLIANEDVCYLSLEYYHGDLTKQNRFFNALHDYCRDELLLEDLLCSYSKIILEVLAEKRVGFYGWSDSTQQLAGLEKEIVSIA